DSAAGGTRARMAPKSELETGTVRGAVVNARAGAVRTCDLHHDGETKPGAAAGGTLAAPEALENPRPVIDRHTGTAIADTDSASGIDLDQDLGSGRGIRQRVLNEIAQRIFDCGSITVHHHRIVGAGERYGAARRERPVRHRSDDVMTELPQIQHC